eukprot:2123788-Pleurochrysis_carterae.AAC.1
MAQARTGALIRQGWSVFAARSDRRLAVRLSGVCRAVDPALFARAPCRSAAEADWRQRQIRLYAEFEERKRRLQEAQQHQRKKLRESCDEALCPLYTEGS